MITDRLKSGIQDFLILLILEAWIWEAGWKPRWSQENTWAPHKNFYYFHHQMAIFHSDQCKYKSKSKESDFFNGFVIFLAVNYCQTHGIFSDWFHRGFYLCDNHHLVPASTDTHTKAAHYLLNHKFFKMGVNHPSTKREFGFLFLEC